MAKFEPQITTTSSLLKPEIVFFGSGFISRKSLEAVSSQFTVEAVVTKSGGGAHNSQTLSQVEAYANEHGFDSFQADSAESLQQLFSEHSFRSQLGLVVDYGVIIPGNVIDFFPLGIVNSHFSLLPKYRGADPIRTAIVNGDAKTGVTLMKIVPKLDAGPIIAQRELAIADTDTARSLTTKLVELNAELLTTKLVDYSQSKIELSEQDHSAATFTGKLTKQDGQIDWTGPAELIERKIRAYTPWPGAFTKLASTDVTLLNAEVLDTQQNSDTKTGVAYQTDDKLAVNCGDNTALEIKKLKVHGRGEMQAMDFINGYLS